jgi:DNA ligase 1
MGRYSIVVRTPGVPELDVVKGTYSSLKEAQDAVTLGPKFQHFPWRKHGEEYEWTAGANIWAVPDDKPRAAEWSYKVREVPKSKTMGKHWRLEIARRGVVTETFATSSRKDAEALGDRFLRRKNPRRNPGVEVRQLGTMFFVYKDGAPTGKNAKTRAKAEALAAAMTTTPAVTAPAPRAAPAARPAPAPRPVRVAPAAAPVAAPAGVMLAKPYAGTDPTGWWMSEKLDGVRAYWTGTHFYTRNGNPIHAPEWFTRSLPNIALDGELTAGRGAFQQTVSAVRKQVPVDTEWRSISFQVFDAPTVRGGCEARWAEMNRVVTGVPHVFALQQTRCSSPWHLAQVRAEIAALGGEGVMLREAGSAYEQRRTGALRKVKSFQDAEARITGHTAGTGKHAGRLGAYEAVLLKGSRAKFRIGTGISDAERERPLSVGTIVTVKFQELTDDGVPRFPALVGARDYE